MNKYSKISIVAIIAIIIPFAYSAMNIYGAQQLHYSWGDQKKFSFFELSNNGNVKFCNAMPYWMSFKKFEINTFYDLNSIGKFTVEPLVINPSSYAVQKGTFHSEDFTEAQYLFMQLDFEFNGGEIRVDPNKLYTLVNIDTPIIGVIPYTTTVQYSGFDLYNIMNDKNSDCN
ncbi:MAG: thr operon leader peptide [Nitrosarchaeum sp.]|nr:thr operon leader peptide [Nitrosarchaeum sp.]